mgnify:CR=1 FL=1
MVNESVCIVIAWVQKAVSDHKPAIAATIRQVVQKMFVILPWFSDADYAQLLIDFLKGQNITVIGAIVGSGGGGSGGTVIIIDCNGDVCKVETQ